MKSILCKQFGSPDLLEFAESILPELKNDQILIDVYYCGVNFPDTLIIQDKYQFKPPLPFSPGGEVSGIVVAIGTDVKKIKIGDRVMALCGWGGMAEQVIVKYTHVFPIPHQLDLLNASSCMYTFGTSFYALKNKANLQPGQTILILGAAGGVGSTAILLAKLMGAKVIAAASNNDKLDYCKLMGADEVINYTTENLKLRIKEITQNKGVDIIYDSVGGLMAEDALKSIAWNGQYLIIGFASGEIPKLPFNLALLKGCTIHGVFWGAFAEKEAIVNRDNFIQLIQWIIQGKIKQHIHQVYSLSEAPKALQQMMDREIKGKAVIQIQKEKEPIITNTTPIDIEKKNIDSDVLIKKLIINGKSSINQHIGKTIGPSNWFTITQKMINDFAATTLDFQWVHIDEKMAAQYLPEGKTLAHGYLTMSMVSHLLYELIELKQVESFYNYGFNKARFISPVRVNDFIRLIAKLERAEDQPNGSIKLFLSCTIEIKGMDKPAYVAEIISVIN